MPLKVVLKNFLNHFETLEARKRLGDDLFEAEFQSLKELTEGLKSDPQYASTEGQKEVNRRKNRYKDILPYNCTRVILSEYPGVPGSDYINANLIKGASGSKAYIASQGPLPTTVMDFWRMIWECEVQVIIMACNEKESGKYKCERYWPNEGETKQYGNITVELVKWKQVCPDFVLRTLRARCGQEERTICQFHYWTWPDHGVPTTVGPIVDLVRLVRDCQASEALPVLVHCSAGCGRTGTICAIDYVWGLMRVGKLSESFSLYQIIREMRMQRVAMVQTKEQYVLVHRVVAALFEQQLRIIDSHTYENLDEDGEPLLGKGLSASSDKIYENIDDLVLNEKEPCDDGEEEEKCDKEKEVPVSTEEIPTLPSLPKRDGGARTNVALTREDSRSQNDTSNRSGSWTPEPVSNDTSSSPISLSDRRMSSRSSAITDDEDSQSCKEDTARDKQALMVKTLSRRTKAADDSEAKFEKSVPNLTRSLSATNIMSGLSVSASQDEDCGKKVGKATVIRRPSIARLKALFERSISTDSDEPSGEVRKRRPIFRSYSQRVTPNAPAVAHTPSIAEKPTSKQKPVLLERRSLGPSARKAREFRELEKNQKSFCSEPPTDQATGALVAPSVSEGTGSASGSQDFGTPSKWYSGASMLTDENRKAGGLHKSLSSSNLTTAMDLSNGWCDKDTKPTPPKRDLSLYSSSTAPLPYNPPPILPTKKRTAQAMYTPVPSRLAESRRKSRTLPSRASEGCPSAAPSKSSLYDFLPASSSRAEVPPRLPPKRAQPSRVRPQPVPLSALSNTYVNVLDVLAAKRELLARLHEGHRRFEEQRRANINSEVNENVKQVERTSQPQEKRAAVDLTPKKLAEERNAEGPQYERIWYGSRLRVKEEESDIDTSCDAEHHFLPGKLRNDATDSALGKGRSATLPPAFRASDCRVENTPVSSSAFCGKWEGHGYSSAAPSDVDMSDIYTTTSEEQTCSGTDYDTLFVESNDTTGTDVPSEEDPSRMLGASTVAPSKSNELFPKEMIMGVTPGVDKHPVLTKLRSVGPFVRVEPRPDVSQPSFYEHIYPAPVRSAPLPLSARAAEEDFLLAQPPPKPPRTFEHGKFDRGRLIVSVVSPKKLPLECRGEDTASLHPKPQPRPRPSVTSPEMSDVVVSAGTAASISSCHPQHPVSHVYENIYAERIVPFTTDEVKRRARPASTIIKQQHLECRPPGSRPMLEPTRSVVPDACQGKLLQHSLSDASVYEVLRASLQHQQQHPSVVEQAGSPYAVVRKQGKHKMSVAASEDQRQKPAEGIQEPSAPPRVRRQVERLESRGNGQDAPKGTACKEGGSDTGVPSAQPRPALTPRGKVPGKDNSGSESGSISGSLSKALGKLNPFSKASSSSGGDSKKKSPPLKSVVKKPAIPKKPQTVVSLAVARTAPQVDATPRGTSQPSAPQPLQVSSPEPLEPASPGASSEEHWTRV